MNGVVEAPFGTGTRKIEVLRNVKGLGASEIADAIPVRVGDVEVNLLAPTKVLKAKICNVVTLDQTDRNDVNHVRIMIACVREFILDLLASVAANNATQRDLVDLLEELRETLTDSTARKAAKMWDLDFSAVWPVDDLANSGMQKIQRFLQYRLPTVD